MSRTSIFGSLLYMVVMTGLVAWHALSGTHAPKAAAKPKTLSSIRALPANYLLRDIDLQGDGKKSELSGKYLVRPIAQGATISDDALADDPALDDAHDGLLRLSFSAKAADAGRGNAESSILICRGEEKLGRARVIAQYCDDAGGECHVLVGPSEQAPPLSLSGLRATVDTCGLAPSVGADALK